MVSATFDYNKLHDRIDQDPGSCVIQYMDYAVIGIAMRRTLKIALLALVLASFSACVVVPPSATYVGPGVTFVAPAPYYSPGYGHHPYRREWDRRW